MSVKKRLDGVDTRLALRMGCGEPLGGLSSELLRRGVGRTPAEKPGQPVTVRRRGE